MILDHENEFSDDQAVTATAIGEDVIDLSGAPVLQDIGGGEAVWLVITVGTAATAAGAATVTFTLESDSTTDLATSPTVHFSSAAISKDALTAGACPVAVRLPADDYERYVGVRYTVATGPLTAGTFNAFFTNTPDTYRSYPDGKTISG